jgi:C-terminal processing protease CtpA/Prc
MDEQRSRDGGQFRGRENQLATIVGHKTCGNVLGAMNFKVVVAMPVFGWFTSNGRSLEGNGVDPHVSVEISPDALADGQDNQMTMAVEIVNGL